MNKIKSKLHLKLHSTILSTTAFIGLFSLIPQPVNAQQISPTTSFWNKIFKPSRRDPEPPIKPRKGSSRGPVCLISPDAPGKTRIIWNTKPFFLWKGDIKKIALGIYGSKEYLKTQIVTGSQKANYTGRPLEPGKTYRWSISLSEVDTASYTMFVPFKIMSAPQRNRIGAELRLIERLYKDKGTEKIALTKAKYFAEKGLWSDALQQAYSVPNPSPELSQMIEDIPNELCK